MDRRRVNPKGWTSDILGAREYCSTTLASVAAVRELLLELESLASRASIRQGGTCAPWRHDVSLLSWKYQHTAVTSEKGVSLFFRSLFVDGHSNELATAVWFKTGLAGRLRCRDVRCELPGRWHQSPTMVRSSRSGPGSKLSPPHSGKKSQSGIAESVLSDLLSRDHNPNDARMSQALSSQSEALTSDATGCRVTQRKGLASLIKKPSEDCSLPLIVFHLSVPVPKAAVLCLSDTARWHPCSLLSLRTITILIPGHYPCLP